MNIAFSLNDSPVTVDVDPSRPLRDVLRTECERTDVKVGCDSGRCGVCTVLVDGDVTKSCLVMAGQADGSTVRTLGGMRENEVVIDLQRAFVEHGAMQCGYCTPGFVLAAFAHVTDDGSTDRERIKANLKGNVCRCTGYRKLLDAVEAVSQSYATR